MGIKILIYEGTKDPSCYYYYLTKLKVNQGEEVAEKRLTVTTT